MEKEKLYQTIAKNITSLRRNAKMTQLELADQLHYSDKTISKWERGEAIPDMENLIQIAELFNVTVNDIVYEQIDSRKTSDINHDLFTWKHYFITLISICIPYLLLTIGLFVLGAYQKEIFIEYWLPILLYGVTLSFVVWLVFATLWWPSLWQQVTCSGIVWSLAVAIHLTFDDVMVLLVYGIALVLQVAIIFWWLLRKSVGLKREKWLWMPKKVIK